MTGESEMKESNEKLLLGGVAFVLYVLMGPAARITQALGIVGACVGGPLLTFCFLMIPAMLWIKVTSKSNPAEVRFTIRLLWLAAVAIVALPIVMELGNGWSRLRTDEGLIDKGIWLAMFCASTMWFLVKMLESAWREERKKAAEAMELSIADQGSRSALANSIVQRLRMGETLTFHSRKGYWGWCLELLPYLLASVGVAVYLQVHHAIGLLGWSGMVLWVALFAVAFYRLASDYQEKLVADQGGVSMYKRANRSQRLKWREINGITAWVLPGRNPARGLLFIPGGYYGMAVQSKNGPGMVVQHSIELLPAIVQVAAAMAGVRPEMVNVKM
jgi:hypothetical protein